MPDVILSNTFKKALSAMTEKDQKRVWQALCKLQSDPRYSSLRTKKVQALEDVFESSASDNIRVLWKWQDGKILLLLVGGHEIVEY